MAVFNVASIVIDGVTYTNVKGEPKRFDMNLITDEGVIIMDIFDSVGAQVKIHGEVEFTWTGNPQVEADLKQALIQKLASVGITL